MKTTKKVSLLTGIIVGSLITLSSAVAGVADTKHNLGTGGALVVGSTNYMDGTTGGTGEVCVFCHTPHGSDDSAAVPLWNKTIDATGFTTYDSLGTSSLDGGIAAVGSVSVACLSCHDGSQAMDVMLNQPGSGGNISGDAKSRLTGSWAGAGAAVGTDGKMPAGIANIGKDLQNDHPVGIQYAGGGYTVGTGSQATAVDKDFKTATEVTVNGLPVWYVETGANTGREKTDLPLYTRNVSGWNKKGVDTGLGEVAAVNQPYVECASCHDPHQDTNLTFLRIPNTGSDVCLACHIK